MDEDNSAVRAGGKGSWVEVGKAGNNRDICKNVNNKKIKNK